MKLNLVLAVSAGLLMPAAADSAQSVKQTVKTPAPAVAPAKPAQPPVKAAAQPQAKDEQPDAQEQDDTPALDNGQWEYGVSTIDGEAEGGGDTEAPPEQQYEPVKPTTVSASMIPASFGALKGVVTQPNRLAFCFEDEYGNIRIVNIKGAGKKAVWEVETEFQRE